MNATVERLSQNDIGRFIELLRVFRDVFDMKNFHMPAETYLQEVLAHDDFFVFVALIDHQVVGGLTSYLLKQYYSQSPLVYIYDLAVATAVQRKGIGKMLVAANNEYAKMLGAETVMVQADEADDYAINFYRSTGANGEKVIHFDYLLQGS